MLFKKKMMNLMTKLTNQKIKFQVQKKLTQIKMKDYKNPKKINRIN